MKYIVLLLSLWVCSVSLPVTSVVVAEDPSADAASSAEIAEDAIDGAAAETEATDKQPDAADKNGAPEKATEEPAAAAADAKPDAQKADTKETTDAAEKKEAEPASEAKKEEKKEERKTHKVAKKRLKVDITLDGTFTAEKMAEVALRPDVWSQFEIVEVIEHGAEVHEGQTLIKFDDEKINEEIAELELTQRLSELAIRKAEEELPRLEKTLAMNATEADRLNQYAQLDYDRYHKTDRPMLLKSIEYSVKYAQFVLDYQQEELDQLQKMYEADDLTEETEEIILKRQRNSVEFARFNLEQTHQYRDEVLNVRLPRADIRIKDSLDRAALELTRAKSALALDLNRSRYELEQQKKARTKSLDRHAKLLGDRGLMEIKAPSAGIAYFGKCEDGRWSDMASMISKLQPHNNVSSGTVLMTIVERRPLSVAAQVGEDKLPDVAPGQQVKVVPPPADSERLDAKVKSVSAVPVTTGKFAVEVDLSGSDLPDWIVAGMSCKLKINTYDKEDALVVPKKAVHTDEYDEEQKYVWLVDPEDAEAKPQRRIVKLGKTSGDDVEVLKGLKVGDVVSLEDEAKKEKEE